jgi:RHS repeat-associated protein
MAGDEITATTQYYYQNAVTNGTGNNLSGQIITSLIQSILGSSSASTLAKSNTANINTELSVDPGFLNATNPGAGNATGTNPKAYLSVIFFDERFNFVSEGSTALRVTDAGNNAAPLVLPNIKSPKNGYAYIYVSNESNEPVYFDNLHVGDNRGRLIEEDHYYAYGLKIIGLSSNKLGDGNEGILQNRYQYQSRSSEMDEDIGWNDFALRNYDSQIGRWAQQDPNDEYPSPYTGMGNDPISNIDPSGGLIASGLFEGMTQFGKAAVITLGGAMIGAGIDLVSGGEGDKGLLIGAGVGLGSSFTGTFNIALDIFRNSLQIEQKIIKRTLVDLNDHLYDAHNKLDTWNKKNREDFSNHFGTDDDYARKGIKTLVEKEQKLVKYYLHQGRYKTKIRHTHQFDNSSRHVYGNTKYDDFSHNVGLEKYFWSAPRRGQDSKFGTMAHEFSHFGDIGLTQDFGKGIGGARKQKAIPYKALLNADNFEYFIENIRL